MTDFFSFATALLNTLFPRRCLVCSVFLSHPLSYPSKNQVLENYLCASCQQQLRIFEGSLDAVRLSEVEKVLSGYLYSGPLEKIIPAWKYHNRHEFFPLVKVLMGLVLSRQESSGLVFDLVIAIPLSKPALRKRGFNQAFFIASCCSEFFKLPLGRNLLVKIIDTPQQASLNRRARALNVRPDIFQVSEPERIAGRNILLCDDVLTTGATLSAAASVLKRAGAASVGALTLARVPG